MRVLLDRNPLAVDALFQGISITSRRSALSTGVRARRRRRNIPALLGVLLGRDPVSVLTLPESRALTVGLTLRPIGVRTGRLRDRYALVDLHALVALVLDSRPDRVGSGLVERVVDVVPGSCAAVPEVPLDAVDGTVVVIHVEVDAEGSLSGRGACDDGPARIHGNGTPVDCLWGSLSRFSRVLRPVVPSRERRVRDDGNRCDDVELSSGGVRPPGHTSNLRPRPGHVPPVEDDIVVPDIENIRLHDCHELDLSSWASLPLYTIEA